MDRRSNRARARARAKAREGEVPMADADELRRNALLARLPSRELTAIRGRLEVVHVEPRLGVYDAGSPIDHVYLPLGAVFSLVAIADERVMVEVATVGREGMVGLPLFLGAATSPHACFCQVSGEAARLKGAQLGEVLADAPGLHQLLNRFTQATIVNIAQNVVCNNTHDGRRRAARWLLTTRDRVARDSFELTQEFLGQMLGLRRPTVSEIARQLQADGLIRYRRGQMTITDPPALLEVACSCYGLVKREFDALLK